MKWFRRRKAEKKEQEPTTLRGKLWHEWIRPIGMVVIVFSTFRSAIADWNDVPTSSMEPSILIGDRIFVNKLAFGLRVPFTTTWMTRWDGPSHGDVVVCLSPADGKRLVKRVVGVPGDSLEIRERRLYINGVGAEYDQLDAELMTPIKLERPGRHQFATEKVAGDEHPVMFTPGVQGAPATFGPIVVPDGKYFLMGDNRDMSGDSRLFGFVDASQILGRSGRVVFSLDHDNMYMPRLDRFLRRLP